MEKGGEFVSETLTRDNYADTLSYNAGEIILFPGKADNIYRVRDGLVRIHSVTDDGNGLTLRYVKPGGYFGEEAIADLRRSYFAEAMTKATVEVISPLTLGPQENLDLTSHLVEALEHLYQSLHRLSGKRLRARLAAELLDLQDSALASRNSEGKPVVHITHDELAAAVGSVRETVTKVIGELARTGAIDAGYGKVILNNTELLETIAKE